MSYTRNCKYDRNVLNAASPCIDPIFEVPTPRGDAPQHVRLGYLKETPDWNDDLIPLSIHPPTTAVYSPWNTLSKQLCFYDKWFAPVIVDRFIQTHNCTNVVRQSPQVHGCWNVFKFNVHGMSAKNKLMFVSEWLRHDCDRQILLQKNSGIHNQYDSFMPLLFPLNHSRDWIYFIHWIYNDDNSTNVLGDGLCWNPTRILNDANIISMMTFENCKDSHKIKCVIQWYVDPWLSVSTVSKSQIASVFEWFTKMIPVCFEEANDMTNHEMVPRRRVANMIDSVCM